MDLVWYGMDMGWYGMVYHIIVDLAMGEPEPEPLPAGPKLEGEKISSFFRGPPVPVISSKAFSV